MAVAAFVRILRTTVKRLSFIVRGIPPRDWPRFFCNQVVTVRSLTGKNASEYL